MHQNTQLHLQHLQESSDRLANNPGAVSEFSNWKIKASEAPGQQSRAGLSWFYFLHKQNGAWLVFLSVSQKFIGSGAELIQR